MKEIWKDIEGYEGLYQISSEGRVKGLERKYASGRDYKTIKVQPEYIMKQVENYEGYNIVTLTKNSKGKSFRTHRLVALNFIPNTENKPDVNHKNGVRNDNRVENLEWVTNLENQRHSWRELGRKQERTRKVLCVELNKEFDSIKEAAEYCGLSLSQQMHITDCLCGRRSATGGYHWKAIERGW